MIWYSCTGKNWTVSSSVVNSQLRMILHDFSISVASQSILAFRILRFVELTAWIGSRTTKLNFEVPPLVVQNNPKSSRSWRIYIQVSNKTWERTDPVTISSAYTFDYYIDVGISWHRPRSGGVWRSLSRTNQSSFTEMLVKNREVSADFELYSIPKKKSLRSGRYFYYLA